MSVDVIAEVWDVVRHHIDLSSRSEAAEELVAYMIENNFQPSEIKTEFRGDKEIAKALLIYDDQHTHDDDEDDYDDIYDEDDTY
jgi:hypothetical protein